MSKKAFVTGANGHVGNNLVRTLIDRGETVVAGVRDPSRAQLLRDLGCEVVRADLLDKSSLVEAFQGIDVLYQVGAVYKQWAKSPDKEIVAPNLEGTRNVIEAAAQAKVSRVVYVSSLVTLDRSVVPIDESTWNPDTDNEYARSKTEAEKLAWSLAGEHGVDMVSVLPGAIVGANCFKMTPTMNLLKMIVDNKLSANPGFYFNFVDVRDVASGMVTAAQHGRRGERYLLANDNCMSVGEVVRIAQETLSERRIKTPPKLPQAVLRIVAGLMEAVARVTGNEPQLRRNYFSEFTTCEQCDIAKARRELGYDPRPPRDAVADALRYLGGEERSATTFKPV